MPACFQLVPKSGSTEPEKLHVVDEKICTHMGVPVHPTRYFHGWFDSIGFAIASGKDLGSDALLSAVMEYDDRILDKILAFLEANYTSRAWYERK